MPENTSFLATSLGMLRIKAHGDVVYGIEFIRASSSRSSSSMVPVSPVVLDEIVKATEGKPFTIQYEFEGGTPFQRIVWNELSNIKLGEVVSYAELTKVLSQTSNGLINVKAVRAVASACGKNPLPIIVPCHRIIKSNGEVGKYLAGTEIKKRLLNKELGKEVYK